MPNTDVLIVGAGLAGLTCARHLHRRGLACKIVEASDGVGGRVRTDRVDGFLLDRGFQVLLTAYPETQRELDYAALRLGTFYAGALVRTPEGAFHRVADPLRHPLGGLQTLFAPVGSLEDKLRVAFLRQGVRRGSLAALFAREEMTTIRALRERWGFSDEMIDRFFRPFLGGILLDGELRASSRMFEFVFRMFSEGRAALPARGMGALPEQIAAGLPPGTVRLNARAEAVSARTVTLEDGETLTAARAVVVATEAPEARRLLGDVEPADARTTTTLYYAADAPPVQEAILVLNGTGQGPINTVTVLSEAAPSYAPPGRSLLSVSVLGTPDTDGALEKSVRQQLAAWYGAAAHGWEHLRTYRIAYALPEQAPPFLSPPQKPLRHASGCFLCGDHRRTASLNGALASGRHAAEAVAAL